jgi:hypothetical protein
MAKPAATRKPPKGGAEAVLKLRALISNGDFEDYWTWHLDQEQQRIHYTTTPQA